MARKNREEYNEYMRSYMLRRYHQRRGEAIQILGGECSYCGSEEGLELDHVDWRNKGISLNRLWSISKERFLAELKKCQVLCKDCHLEKTSSDMSAIKKEYWRKIREQRE